MRSMSAEIGKFTTELNTDHLHRLRMHFFDMQTFLKKMNVGLETGDFSSASFKFFLGELLGEQIGKPAFRLREILKELERGRVVTLTPDLDIKQEKPLNGQWSIPGDLKEDLGLQTLPHLLLPIYKDHQNESLKVMEAILSGKQWELIHPSRIKPTDFLR